jgi:hypothetical protein
MSKRISIPEPKTMTAEWKAKRLHEQCNLLRKRLEITTHERNEANHTAQVWFERYHEAHKLSGQEPHHHHLPEWITQILKELDKYKEQCGKLLLALTSIRDHTPAADSRHAVLTADQALRGVPVDNAMLDSDPVPEKCSQCGQPWARPACGFSHIAIASELGVYEDPEGGDDVEEAQK